MPDYMAMQGRCDNEECLALITLHSDEETADASIEAIDTMELASFSHCLVCDDGTIDWNGTDFLRDIARRFTDDARALQPVPLKEPEAAIGPDSETPHG